jgi:hypothetical protein
MATVKISELPTGQKVGNVIAETLTIQTAVTSGNTPGARFLRSDALTNAVGVGLDLRHETSGTPAAGLGVSQTFSVQTAGGNTEIGASIDVAATDVTDTSEDFDMNLRTMGAGGTRATRLKLNATGATITGQLVLGNAAVTGLVAGAEAALTNATITLTDSTGQVYRIPCII